MIISLVIASVELKTDKRITIEDFFHAFQRKRTKFNVRL